jgi:hypothetical protein
MKQTTDIYQLPNHWISLRGPSPNGNNGHNLQIIADAPPFLKLLTRYTHVTNELKSQTYAHLGTVGDKEHKGDPIFHQTLYLKDVLVSGGMAPCILNHALYEL